MDTTRLDSDRVFTGHTAWLKCLCVDHRGRLYTGSTDKTVRCYDPATGALLRVFAGHTGTVYCAQVHGDTLFTGSFDKTVRAYDMADNVLKHTFKGHTGWVHSLCVSADGAHVVTA